MAFGAAASPVSTSSSFTCVIIASMSVATECSTDGSIRGDRSLGSPS